jgi:hemoglobin
MNELTKEHIKTLVVNFYHQVQHDEQLGVIFNDVAQVDWDHHIPLICQFWNSIMLKTNEYHGNAFQQHLLLGKKVSLTEAHFARWLSLFETEACKHLPLQAAHTIVQRARLIADSLKLGILSTDKYH